MAKVTSSDRRLAKKILRDLSDRAGVPEWLGDDRDEDARRVRGEIAQLIADHREPMPPISIGQRDLKPENG